MTELSREVASVPRDSDGERVGEKRVIEVGGEEYDVWVLPMSIGDQFEFNQRDLDLNELVDPEVVFEIYNTFLAPRSKRNLAHGDEFRQSDMEDLRLEVATELMEAITDAAGVEMGEEERQQLQEALAGN